MKKKYHFYFFIITFWEKQNKQKNIVTLPFRIVLARTKAYVIFMFLGT